MTQEYEECVRIRSAVKGKLQVFKTFIEDYEKNPDSFGLRIRYDRFKSQLGEFEDIQKKIELISTEFNKDLAERVEFENSSLQYITIAERIFESINTVNDSVVNPTETASDASVAPISGSTAQVNYSKLELPKFNGRLEDWPNFSDSFRASVHNEKRFSDVQKLTYLRSCLTGKAAIKIESLPTTDINYKVAWELLEKAYLDPDYLIFKHVEAFFKLPQCDMSANAIIDITDISRKHLRALQALKRPFLEYFPIHAIMSKLDETTKLKWKEVSSDDQEASLEELLEFLHRRGRMLQGSVQDKTTKQFNSSTNNKRFHKKPQSSTTLSAQISAYCHICKNNHFTQQCKTLIDLSVDDRKQLIAKLKLCFNCLRANHAVKDCRSNGCKTCKKKHHTLLHKTETTAISCLSYNTGNKVLLPTALVNFTDINGGLHQARVLLDSCSQTNFISKTLAGKLGAPLKRVNILVTGINDARNSYTREIEATLQSRASRFTTTLRFLIRENFQEVVPSSRVNLSELGLPANISLADPQFHTPNGIDALLGAKIFFKILCAKQKKLKSRDALLQKTRLGWVVTGDVPVENNNTDVICNLSTEILDKRLESFWEVEQVPANKLMSNDESYCEKHYINNTIRDPITGRYIVRLPLKCSKSELGDSYSRALKRFYHLEKTLEKNIDLKKQYIAFLREYENLGHMSKCDHSHKNHYLPHHGVIKQSSHTTKLRVVFDASSKTNNGLSLNDILHVGPVIQDDIFCIILRFRLHAYVITADIEKMYRQIEIHMDDRSLQNILWRESNDAPIQSYQLNTITYGTASASFLATRTLHQLARDEERNFPKAARALINDFYMDDLLTGANSINEARNLRDKMLKITEKGKLPLRQWASNDKRLVEDLNNDSGKCYVKLDNGESMKTLGVFWNANDDTITYCINELSNSHVTKRSILSQISKLFDPLGLLGPVIIRVKILMQQLWQLKLDWDAPLPLSIASTWLQYRDDLSTLDQLRIPRKVILNNYRIIELHGFCDASEKAYGACIFIKTCDDKKNTYAKLLCAKSKVAPLKSLSVPRLELYAALLLSKLYLSVKTALRDMKFNKVIFWSDSSIVLNWILTPPHKLKTFVNNRVAQIQELTTDGTWRHVSTSQNPADLISRGVAPSELLNNNLWNNGPSWLTSDECEWPESKIKLVEIPELKTNVTLVAVPSECSIFQRFSSFKRLIRVFALCLRFINNCRKTNKIMESSLQLDEIRKSTTCIIKIIQRERFSKEVDSLKNNRILRSNMAALTPFMDNEGVLRVGGRLRQSDLNFNQKHQAIIPNNHYVTDLIIKDVHEKSFHAGAQATLSLLRNDYWLMNGLQYLKTRLAKCFICKRLKPITPEYTMGDLPQGRVINSRPFLHTGVDLCGPFFIKEKRLRNRKILKIYISVFICFSTKAVHLELVEDLSSNAFLAALRCFCARRGKPSDIYSDNATNFIGTRRYLTEIRSFLTNKEEIARIELKLVNESIKWHFIPPRAPHFGGLWEAAVKSTKRHLLHVAKNALLTYETMLTLINEIEAILNSRPLTPLSSDPNDLRALTPGHFLIGEPLTSIPTESNLEYQPSSALSQYKQLQNIRHHFWERWRKEYLHTLTVRSKWHTKGQPCIKIGSLVVIKENNVSPLKWPMARVIDVHPGTDGIVRVVTVKTTSGEFKRAVKGLSPLPMEEQL